MENVSFFIQDKFRLWGEGSSKLAKVALDLMDYFNFADVVGFASKVELNTFRVIRVFVKFVDPFFLGGIRTTHEKH